MSRLTPGSHLGPYAIVAPLGAGGMGEVWRVRDPRLGREVALKLLPADVAASADRLARFEREARAVAALSHPNIVTIHSIEEADGVRFLTMELVEGETLDRSDAAGGGDLDRILGVAVELADALAAAHERGVVHRDLKPANVMLTRAGRVKVLDFGLARFDDASAGDPGATFAPALTAEAPISSAGVAMGTVPYMAPEQVKGEPVDARADLFSFGILLYELVTGRRPFAGKSWAEVSSSILRDVPTPILALRADLPKDLERIVARCLEKDRERRFQTAKDVRNELALVRRELAGTVGGTSGVRPAVAPVQELPSVAVLPFANRSASADDEYFSDGLADELLNVLAKIKGLRVAARTSSATFKGKSASIAEVGEALRVATVLEGSVRKAGNRVRIAVQLVKVEDGYPLWSETYDRTLDDIFAVQDDIAQSVVKELRVHLLGEAPDSDASREVKAEVAAAAVGRGTNAEAHRLYLQGRHLLDRLNDEDVRGGIAFIQQALALDSDFAQAWAALALAHIYRGGWGWASPSEAYEEARAATDRALAIEPGLAEAWVLRARIAVSFDRDFRATREALAHALALAPTNVDVLAGSATLDLYEGRPADAVEGLRRVLERDPLNAVTYGSLGFGLRALGRLEEAEAAYRRLLELYPKRVAARSMLGLVLGEQGRFDEARREARLEPADWSRLTGLCAIEFLAGREEESRAALLELERTHPNDSAWQIAVLHGYRGEVDEAFDWIERAIETRDSGLVFLRAEPRLKPLHADPRWAGILRMAGAAS